MHQSLTKESILCEHTLLVNKLKVNVTSSVNNMTNIDTLNNVVLLYQYCTVYSTSNLSQIIAYFYLQNLVPNINTAPNLFIEEPVR